MKMNKRTFLNNLSKLKHYSWYRNKFGAIRTRHKQYCTCPIIVMNWYKTGKWESLLDAVDLLGVLDTRLITVAADVSDKKNRFRQAMLRRLGLPLDK